MSDPIFPIRRATRPTSRAIERGRIVRVTSDPHNLYGGAGQLGVVVADETDAEAFAFGLSRGMARVAFESGSICEMQAPAIAADLEVTHWVSNQTHDEPYRGDDDVRCALEDGRHGTVFALVRNPLALLNDNDYPRFA